MSDSGEETYSTMFTSLKHPARRKILRMLGEKPKNFSRILEELGISSSHLTYHLENLGELVTKMDDGRYRLSTFGKAAVLTMKGVEETPEVEPKQLFGLPVKWRTIFAVLMIVIVVLAAVSYMQHEALSNLSSEHDQLVDDFEQLIADHERSMVWGTSTDQVMSFLENVIQLDMTKYIAELERNTVGYRSDLGGIREEFLTYRLTSDESELFIDFRFRNQTLSRYLMDVIEGAPIYVQPQLTNVVDLADEILQRYQEYSNFSYLDTMRTMLNTINEPGDIELTVGDIKLAVSSDGQDIEIKWMKTVSGINYQTITDIDYQAKSVIFNFENGVLEGLTDGWFIFNVGSTEISVSEDEAIALAIGYAQDYSWVVDGVEVTDFVVLDVPASVNLWPHIREEPLDLIPYWYVVVRLDKVYPGNVNSIGIGLWADTGEASGYKTLNTE